MNEGGSGGGAKGPAEPGDAATATVARGGVREAEVRLPSHDLHADLSFFGKTLGFRLDSIFPADDPAVAVISGHGLRLRLERGAGEAPGTIRLLCDVPAASTGARQDLVAPNGTRIEIRSADHLPEIPPPRHALVVQRASGGSWGLGRAGMRYRDLIPGRLGGHVVASHIRIPDGGPVPDLVHYHVAAFQLVFCYRGWVKVVYEDQGAPFDLLAGGCVIQPPEIRHRVLESSRNAEVIELAVPAGHPTVIDHELALPTATRNPDRDFGGQRFCHHRCGDAGWREWRLPGFEARRSGVADATGGQADVQVARRAGAGTGPVTSHDANLLFTFVLEGGMTLRAEGRDAEALTAGDAFVLPPGTRAAYEGCSGDLELLEVSLPGTFETTVHPSPGPRFPESDGAPRWRIAGRKDG